VKSCRSKRGEYLAKFVDLYFVAEALDAKAAIFLGEIDERSGKAYHVVGRITEETREAFVNTA
jgi:hypothetical protein